MKRCLTFFTILLALNCPIEAADPPGLLSHQGRIAVDAVSYDGRGAFKFALVDGGRLILRDPDPPLMVYKTFWSNDGTSSAGAPPVASVSLTVSHGHYSVLLGDTTLRGMTEVIPADVFKNEEVFLRVWFDDGKNGFQQLSPDQRVAPVGYAFQAAGLPDDAVTAAMIADGAVTTARIADAAVTSDKIAPGAVQSIHLNNESEEAFQTFLETIEPLGGTSPLGPGDLVPVVAADGLDPTLRFSIEGAPFGTVIGFVGVEAMSEVSHYIVELLGSGPAVDASSWLGSESTVVLTRNGRATTFGGMITGIQRSARDASGDLYAVRIEPLLAGLTLQSGYGIYQGRTVPEVVEEIYGDGTGDLPIDNTVETYEYAECLVQYRETDFTFITRLLEDEGIFYFFDPTPDPLALVLGDSTDAYQAAPYLIVNYYGNQVAPSAAGEEYVRSFRAATRASTRTLTADGYDFKTPALSLLATATGSGARGEHYAFETTSLAESVLRSAVARDREEVERRSTTGFSNAPDLRPGHTFPLSDLTSAGLSGEYLVTRVHHVAYRPTGEGSGTLLYGNRIEVIPSDLRFRPARKTPRPMVAGSATAVVTGPAGEEIHTDEYGRVKVQFHWDREGVLDENSSCWIRVASPMAGPGGQRGIFFLPEVGDEVLVDFIQGDPDRPVIVGSLYNGANMPPYALPTNKTVSTIRSSSPGGAVNELRFEDKAGSEEVYLRGGKDLLVESQNDATLAAGHDLALDASNALTVNVNGTMTIDTGSDVAVTGGGALDLQMGSTMELSAGTNLGFSAGSNFALSAVASGVFDFGSNWQTTVGKDLALTGGQDVIVTAGHELILNGNVVLNGTSLGVSRVLVAWGSVSSGGLLLAGEGITSIVQPSTGVYIITVGFKATSADSLLPVATLVSGKTTPARDVTLSVRPLTANSFEVLCVSNLGPSASRPFHVMVTGN